MSSISNITILPARQTLALGLIMVTMTMMLTVTTTTTSIFLVPPLVQSALADHGEEIVLTEKDSSFAPISSDEGGNQVKVVVDYAVHDPMFVNDLVKGVMKVYSPDGTLVKTSSSPTPFRITNSHGTVTLATTLKDTTIEGVTAKIVFTNPIKTEIISNELPVSVDLTKGATLSEESQEKITPQDVSQSESLQDSLKKSQSEESQENITSQDQSQSESFQDIVKKSQSEEPEEVPIIQGNQQGTSIESMPQTTTNNPSTPQTTTTYASAPYITEVICDDGIDNDSDTLIDLSDRDCNPIQLQQQPTLQQEQTMGQTPEVCEDGLDNDLDGKIDGNDEECTGITTSSSSPSIQDQSLAEKQIVEEDEDKDKDKEQPTDEDISENSGEKEDEDKDDDEDEDEDEDSDDDDKEEDE
jgi:hypothetical protein